MRVTHSVSQPGQPALPITGGTTRTFLHLLPDSIPHIAIQGYLMVLNPHEEETMLFIGKNQIEDQLEYFDDIVFLYYDPYHLYHLPAPLPDNFIIIVPVVSVWIVLFSDK